MQSSSRKEVLGRPLLEATQLRQQLRSPARACEGKTGYRWSAGKANNHWPSP
jgi:hypothetical protein